MGRQERGEDCIPGHSAGHDCPGLLSRPGRCQAPNKGQHASQAWQGEWEHLGKGSWKCSGGFTWRHWPDAGPAFPALSLRVSACVGLGGQVTGLATDRRVPDLTGGPTRKLGLGSSGTGLGGWFGCLGDLLVDQRQLAYGTWLWCVVIATGPPVAPECTHAHGSVHQPWSCSPSRSLLQTPNTPARPCLWDTSTCHPCTSTRCLNLMSIVMSPPTWATLGPKFRNPESACLRIQPGVFGNNQKILAMPETPSTQAFCEVSSLEPPRHGLLLSVHTHRSGLPETLLP